eukprot:CAMPEP_0197441962 /NCGR_PEP_ID=MMETSP1175-20131217/8092_1 /TAXON_ID=1003142 /ORGANISM="Triceratium dubium, Strain CCMP147" /LENGTH=193 /DNA_ID=CAMNT_0042972343 /DNA_START=97 /DNA_END=678 /DNA_ORIENTATION=-
MISPPNSSQCARSSPPLLATNDRARNMNSRGGVNKSVTFAEEHLSLVQYEPVLHVSEYSADEKSRQWYSSDDLRKFRNQVLDSVTSQRQTGLNSNKDGSNGIDDDERGLEWHLSGFHPREFAKRARLGVRAVLIEQRRQRKVGVRDEVRVSAVAAERSEFAAQTALRLGATIATERRRDQLNRKLASRCLGTL